MLDSSDDTLKALGLLDTRDTVAFDRLTTLASEMVGTPVSVVSIVLPDEDRQYFKSFVGLPPPWAALRQTPLSHSFCQHVRASGKALIVDDAREHPVVRTNLAIRDLGVIAYMGQPIHGPDGVTIGAFCAIDGKPREWSAADAAIMQRFARVVDDQIALLAALFERDRALACERVAAEAKSRFLATVSHEVRTPLSGVIGLADLLSEDLGKGRGGDMARTIGRSGRALLVIVNDILDMSKIDAGKMTVECEAFDPAETLAEAAAVFAPQAAAKGIGFAVRHDADLARPRLGDRHRLRQMLCNLMSNAVKFTDQGGVTVDAVAEGEGWLAFRVADTGIGMTPAQCARIFAPFEQAEASIARRFGGTGLGMSIVHRLAGLMGGTVTVESRPGAGTDFTLRLPLPPVGAAAAAIAAADDAAPIDLAGLSVLVADDNAVNRTILGAFLGRAGVRVTMVNDGCEAVLRAGGARFDALLLDICMPGLDGVSALGQIRARAATEGAPCPPAVAITANVLPDQRDQYRAAGFAAQCGKPFDRAELLNTLDRLCPRPFVAAAMPPAA